MLEQYLQALFKTMKLGDAREESYYSDLKKLLEVWNEKNKRNIFVTALPKKTEAGNPDFRVWDGKEKIVGYIEAKDPKIENLDSIEDSEQLKRYRDTFPNLILTNFFEFRLYRNGQLIEKVSIGRPFIFHQLKMVPPAENQDKFAQFLSQFFSFSIPKTTTPKALAIELAKRTRFLRDNVISEELKEEKLGGTQTLEGFYRAFKDHLISSLTLQDFSDLFAQTITYGLFAARSRATNGFNRKLAYDYIPHTIGILRDVFRFISSADLPQSMEWIIDDVAEVLATSDVKKIMENFYKEGKGKDPVIHFYETFLSEYDPKEREKRGVYYTPEPVVSYIVRSIHKLLKEEFGKEDGFATQSVTVLDPASGTLTFPVEATKQAVTEFKNKYGEGGVLGLIKTHILKNFYAFELMMAPYAIGHLKIGLVLDEFGYNLSEGERFNLFLTNTLDFTKEDPNKFPGVFEQTIAKESLEALRVKEDVPIMVVMGNPPYSVSSTNIVKEGTKFYDLYESYKEVVRKEERNIQPLSDDYIKFIAFAHWKVKQTGQGIVGMITNNSYLDGLIHRDMREKLLVDFNKIFIFNLHGNRNRKEKTESGKQDENVFDIQQGVSIVFLIKNPQVFKSVKFYEKLGTRSEKYEFLSGNDIMSTKWTELEIEKFDTEFLKTRWSKRYPKGFHFFTQKTSKDILEYGNFMGFDEIFAKNSCGVKTSNDEKIIGFNREDLISRLVGNKIDFSEIDIKKYFYRPFDTRKIFWSKKYIDRSREPLSTSLLEKNLIICLSKNTTIEGQYSSVLVSDSLVDLKYCEYSRGCYFFPLYLYNFSNQQTLIDETRKHANLQFDNISSFSKEKNPEKILNYIYAVLYSNFYRQKYQEFLKIDFPRIPFTKNNELFEKLSRLGEQLILLHLMKSPELTDPIMKYKGPGDSNVEKRLYDETTRRVYIKDLQYFENVDSDVWKYDIGGYQVLDKWLKDRVGKALSAEDIRHYCKVVTAISKTIDIQKEIDRFYAKVENELE